MGNATISQIDVEDMGELISKSGPLESDLELVFGQGGPFEYLCLANPLFIPRVNKVVTVNGEYKYIVTNSIDNNSGKNRSSYVRLSFVSKPGSVLSPEED